MKRMGIEGIYLGGWATSAKGSITEDPGPDLASYPAEPGAGRGRAAGARPAHRRPQPALPALAHDRGAARRDARPSTIRPFIIADADTGHGGDPHVRNLIRRFVEVGVPGYHIEDQRPGTKKCGHQGGKVLVAVGRADQAPQRRALPARRHGGARHHRGAHRRRGGQPPRRPRRRARPAVHPRRDQPQASRPTRSASWRCMKRLLRPSGVDELNGHLLYAHLGRGVRRGRRLARRAGHVGQIADGGAAAGRAGGESPSRPLFDKVESTLRRRLGGRRRARDLRRGGRRGARVPRRRGRALEMTRRGVAALRATAPRSTPPARRPRTLGVDIVWDCERAKTPEGYYQVRGGIQYAIAKSLAAAPFADILWMETKTADLADAARVRRGDPRRVPRQDAGLQPLALVQLGHDRDERRGDAALPRGARQDGLRLQLHHLRRPPDRRRRRRGVRHRAQAGRHAGAGPAAAQDPAGRIALPDAADAGRRSAPATPRSPPRRAARRPPRRWARARRSTSTWSRPRCRRSCSRSGWRSGASTTSSPSRCASSCGRTAPARELLELAHRPGTSGEKLANVVFAPIQDRHGRSILSVRDQNTFDEALRKKRLMTLIHLCLIHRYQGRLGALRHARPRTTSYQTAEDEVARHLHATSTRRSARSSSPTSTPRGSPSCCARSRGARAADPQGGLGGSRPAAGGVTRTALRTGVAPGP